MEKRALSWQEFLDSGFDGRDYNFPDFEGTFEAEMVCICKEIKLCAAIAERSARVQENLEDIRQQESERKEKTTDELLVRRSGRTSRENEEECPPTEYRQRNSAYRW